MKSARTTLLGILFLPLAAHAAPEGSFAELLPADTIAYIETNALTPEEMKRAVAYKALAEPELRRVLDRMLNQESNFSKVAVPLGGATLRASMDIRGPGLAFDIRFQHGKRSHAMKVRGKMAFALVGVESRVRGAVVPDLVAAITVESDPDEARRLVRAVLVSLARGAGGPRKTPRGRRVGEWKHHGVNCSSVAIDRYSIHIGTVGRRIVVTNLRDRLLDVIDRSRKPAKDSLAQSKRHMETIRNAKGDGTITSLFSIDTVLALRALSRANPQKFGQAAMMAQVFGLSGLRGISSVTRADGTGVAGTTSVLIEGRRTGLARFFEEGPPAKFGGLDFAPQQTLYVAAGRIDGGSIFKALAEVAQPLVMGAAMYVQQDFGVNLLEDLMARIGPEAAIIVSLNQGIIPDVGIVVESDDPQRLQTTFLRMLGRVDWEQGTGVERTRLGGVDAYVVKVFHPDMAEVPVAPTFGIVDGYFVATLYPISFQRFVATKRGERPSITKNRDFAALRSRVPPEALSLSYLDVRRGVAIAYDTLMPILQSMPQAEGGVPIYEFPDASVFSRHLYGRIAWRVADERGMHWHSHSSTDVGSIMMGAVSAAVGVAYLTVRADEMQSVGIAVPRPVQSTMKLHEAHHCMDNVRRIRNQLRPYKRAGKPFPAKIQELAKGRWIDKKTLIVPGTNGNAYRYLGPDGKNGLLLVGEPNGPDGHICVLTTDLRMERISPNQLRKMLPSK